MSPDDTSRAAGESAARFADPDRRYRLDEPVATGGMGEVWQATDTRLDRSVAVKLLKKELAGDPTFRKRFATEARNAASLHHPHIASVFDFGDGTQRGEDDVDGSSLPPWLVMEFVRGKPLSELLGGGALDASQTRGIVADVADGLGAAHAVGIVHRDMKPANLIVTPDRRVKITDFGISRAVDSAAVTQTGEVLGTPHYLSPEQASGEQATARSDVYALGVVLHECLAGKRPFDEGSAVQTALAHLRQEPPPLPDDVPSELAAVVTRAMSKDPDERYADGKELASALRGANLGSAPLGAAAAGDGSSTTKVMPGLGKAAAGAAGLAAGAAGAAAAKGGGRDGSASGQGSGRGSGGPGARPGAAGGARRPGNAPPAQSRPGWVPVAWAVGLIVLLLIVAVSILGTQGADRQPVGLDPQDQVDSSAAEPTPEPAPEETQAEPTEDPTVTVDASDYIGRDEKDAESDLKDLGLDVDKEKVANDGSAEEKTVADVSPTGEVPEGSTVTLFVYDKPEEPAPVEEAPAEDAPGNSEDAPGQEKKD